MLSALEARLKHLALYPLPHSSPFSSMPYGAWVQHPTNSFVIYSSFQGQVWRSMLNPVSVLQMRRNSMFSPKEANSAVGIWQSQSLSSVYI